MEKLANHEILERTRLKSRPKRIERLYPLVRRETDPFLQGGFSATSRVSIWTGRARLAVRKLRAASQRGITSRDRAYHPLE